MSEENLVAFIEDYESSEEATAVADEAAVDGREDILSDLGAPISSLAGPAFSIPKKPSPEPTPGVPNAAPKDGDGTGAPDVATADDTGATVAAADEDVADVTISSPVASEHMRPAPESTRASATDSALEPTTAAESEDGKGASSSAWGWLFLGAYGATVAYVASQITKK